MRKILVVTSVLLLGATTLCAGIDAGARAGLKTIRLGLDNADAITDLRVKNDAAIGGDVTVDGTVTAGTVTVGVGALTDGTVTSADITDGTISNVDVAASAAIAGSKLNLTSGVAALSTTGAVGIAEGALTDSTVVSADIKNGEIVDADVNASAAIAGSKLNLTSGVAALSTTGAVQAETFYIEDSAGGDPGTLRIGYPAADGWQVNTTGGGTELIFQRDYARTGGVTKASITTDGSFRDGLLVYGTTQCWFRVSGTQLQFIVGGSGVTNVIDADITTP